MKRAIETSQIPFQHYFRDEAIIRQLVRMRVNTAAKRNQQQFFCQITRSATDPMVMTPPAVDPYLPPRRAWRRPTASQRKGKTKSEIQEISLHRTIDGFRHQGTLEQTEWGERLMRLIRKVQQRMASPLLGEIAHPSLFLKKKINCNLTGTKSAGSDHKKSAVDGNSEGHPESYRIMSRYDRLEDHIIIGITAKYLTDQLDETLDPSACAYRKQNDPSRTSAVQDLITYRKERMGQRIYVTECDLVSFFDTVHHDVAKLALHRAVIAATERGGFVDHRAVTICFDYLSSYSFTGYALPWGRQELAKKHINGAIAGDVSETMHRFYRDPASEPLGLPQGGALSNLLSNLIMDHADRAVHRLAGTQMDADLFYRRFCDDMILMHTNETRCFDGLLRFMTAIRELKLCHHTPVSIKQYNAAYYHHKSKYPYCWEAPFALKGHSKGRNLHDGIESASASASASDNALSLSPAIPWVSFLGYQIKWDGSVRIRKSTLQKEKRTVKELKRSVIHYLEKGGKIHLNPRKIHEKTRLRLHNRSTGRNVLRRHFPKTKQPSWADAFSLVEINPDSAVQLKSLDRNLAQELRSLKKQMNSMRVNKRDTKISKKYRRIRHGGRSATPDHGNNVPISTVNAHGRMENRSPQKMKTESVFTVKRARPRYTIRPDSYYSCFKKKACQDKC